MLIGNPDTFAIWCDPVDSWSTERFKNGCFAYFLGGQLIWSLRSTLGVDMHALSTLHCMRVSVSDDRLFSLATIDAYSEFYASAFPSMDSGAQENDWTHLVSVESLSDNGYNVFLVESDEDAKLLYGRGNELSTVREVTLKRGEFQAVVRAAIEKSKTS
jgi:hypothetical protein